MFDFLAPVLVLGIITLGIYRIFELYARRKERMMMIEKMQGNTNPDALTNQLNLPLIGKSGSSSWALRASLLMIGLGVGVIVGLIVQLAFEFQITSIDAYREYSRHTLKIIYFASVILFGGIGLLIAYLIERKDEKDERERLNSRV